MPAIAAVRVSALASLSASAPSRARTPMSRISASRLNPASSMAGHFAAITRICKGGRLNPLGQGLARASPRARLLQLSETGMRAVLLSIVAAAAAALAGPAGAGCTLAKVAEFPITMQGLRPTVPAKINGREATFLLDTG